MKLQTTHKGKGRNSQSWKSDTHWHQDRSNKQVVQTPSNGWKTVTWKPRSTDWKSTLTDKIMVVDNAHALAQAWKIPLKVIVLLFALLIAQNNMKKWWRWRWEN